MGVESNEFGQLVEKYDGRDAAGMLVEDYALRSVDAGSVPLRLLESLIGTRVLRILSLVSGADWSTNTRADNEAQHLGNAVWTGEGNRSGDELEIEITVKDSGTDAIIATYKFEALADDWLQLDVADVGDTLGFTNSISINAVGSDGSTRTMRIGRDANYRVLHARSAFGLTDSGQVVDARTSLYSYAGGIVGRRIHELRGVEPDHSILLKVRSASAPTLPADFADGITYYGNRVSISNTIATALPGIVYHTDPDPAGSNPLWYIAGNARWDHVLADWTVQDRWVVQADAGSFGVQFSTDGVEAHSTQGLNDLYWRMREATGAWGRWNQLFPGVRGWSMLAFMSWYWNSESWERVGDLNFDLSDYRLLAFDFDPPGAGRQRIITPTLGMQAFVNITSEPSGAIANADVGLFYSYNDDRPSYALRSNDGLPSDGGSPNHSFWIRFLRSPTDTNILTQSTEVRGMMLHNAANTSSGSINRLWVWGI